MVEARASWAGEGAVGSVAGDRRRLPGWLVIGATGRNSGKSDLACAVIAMASRTRRVVGVKVTTIPPGERACPRGKDGCGACTGLSGAFEILEEDGSRPGKDTARMLASGARKAFWLRCRSDGVRTAVDALSLRLEPETLVVAESNSLAGETCPDLFLMVRPSGSSAIKPTAAAVLRLAQRVVVSTDRGFDLDLRHLSVIDGEWHLAEASAAILAGGTSSRMGQDKSLLLVHGRTLVQRILDQLLRRFDDVLLSTNEPEKYPSLRVRTVPDLLPGRGPLMGILSTLDASAHDRVFVTACDIPFIETEVVERMLVLAEGFDCVVSRTSLGPEPLFAVYRKSSLPAIRQVLEEGERRVRALFPRVRALFVDLGSAPWYRNLNTREDLAAYLDTRPERDSTARPGA